MYVLKRLELLEGAEFVFYKISIQVEYHHWIFAVNCLEANGTVVTLRIPEIYSYSICKEGILKLTPSGLRALCYCNITKWYCNIVLLLELLLEEHCQLGHIYLFSERHSCCGGTHRGERRLKRRWWRRRRWRWALNRWRWVRW